MSRIPIPILVEKGRGAVGSPPGRFEVTQRIAEYDGWGDLESPVPCQTTVTDEYARSVISRNTSPDLMFTQSINPYRGCEHGCVYCYARPNHAYLGFSPGKDFESKLFAKVNAAEVLRKELSASSYRCASITLGAATDAYQPIERERKITRSVLQVLEQSRHPVSIITKSSLIERDIDLLVSMARHQLVYVGISVTTLDAKLARIWEPRAGAPWRRIETIRRLTEAGIPVGVLIAPIVPFINDQALEQVMAAAAEVGAIDAYYTILRLPNEVEDVFSQWLQAHYPDRYKRVMSTLKSLRANGRVNESEFFTRMKGQGPWAELIKMRMTLSRRKLGLNRARLNLRTDLFVPPARLGQIGLFE